MGRPAKLDGDSTPTVGSTSEVPNPEFGVEPSTQASAGGFQLTYCNRMKNYGDRNTREVSPAFDTDSIPQ